MKTIKLYGFLKEQFGEEFKINVSSPAMAISALRHQLKGFDAAIRERTFVIYRGNPKDKKNRMQLDKDELLIKLGTENEVHIIPVIQGAGGGGRNLVKALVGYVLIAVGVALLPVLGPASLLISGVGLQLLATGVSGMLTPKVNTTPQNYDNREPPDQRTSFLFNGATNKTEQGGPVPLVYGRVRAGSVVISAGLSAEAVG